VAELEKKSTFGHLLKTNLNPIGDKKFLLDGCEEENLEETFTDIVFYLYLDKKRGAFAPLFLRWRENFT
jgi:hypothetical protein